MKDVSGLPVSPTLLGCAFNVMKTKHNGKKTTKFINILSFNIGYSDSCFTIKYIKISLGIFFAAGSPEREPAVAQYITVRRVFYERRCGGQKSLRGQKSFIFGFVFLTAQAILYVHN